MKTCPCPCGCRASADTLEEIEKIFGWRGKITQSYCRKCRVPHKEISYTENINPIYNMILKNIKKDNVENIHIPKFDDAGKFVIGKEKSGLIQEIIADGFKKSVFEFLTLLEQSEPQIDEKQFIDLFEMYNFHIIKPEQESFFNFIISMDSKESESQQELKPEQNIFVILKIYQIISESVMKILIAQLKDSSAIIISLANDNPLDFTFNNEKICLLDRDLIKCLLEYRIGKKKLSDVHNLFTKKGKL